MGIARGSGLALSCSKEASVTVLSFQGVFPVTQSIMWNWIWRIRTQEDTNAVLMVSNMMPRRAVSSMTVHGKFMAITGDLCIPGLREEVCKPLQGRSLGEKGAQQDCLLYYNLDRF